MQYQINSNLSIINDLDGDDLRAHEERFEAAYQLFLLRLDALHDTGTLIDESEAQELRDILNALIRRHLRICELSGACV